MLALAWVLESLGSSLGYAWEQQSAAESARMLGRVGSSEHSLAPASDGMWVQVLELDLELPFGAASGSQKVQQLGDQLGLESESTLALKSELESAQSRALGLE